MSEWLRRQTRNLLGLPAQVQILLVTFFYESHRATKVIMVHLDKNSAMSIQNSIPNSIQFNFLQKFFKMQSMFGNTESSNYPYLLKAKVILLGDHAVGKSSIIQRYVKGYFQQTKHATVGIDFMSKTVKVSKAGQVKLQMWDTAGQQRFRSLIPGYLKDSMAALIIFDLSNARSFDNISNWLTLVHDVRGVRTRTFLLGNKSDLKQSSVIDEASILSFSKQHDIKYFEVSAKTGEGVYKMFQEICGDLMEDDGKEVKTEVQIQSTSKLADMPCAKMKQNHCCGAI